MSVAMKDGYRNNWLWISALLISVICVILMNVFSIPAHDELSYAFMGQSTPMCGFSPRVASLMDIIRQQYQDYLHANGRVFVHGTVAFFAGFRLYYLFDVINSLVWFAFVFLLLKESRIELNLRRFVCGSMVVFMFWWYAETVNINAAFSVNYLWMACATIAIMRLWRNLHSWWWIPVGFVYGWGQETFSVPMVATLVGSVIIKSVREKRYVATIKQTTFLLAMIIGAIGLVLSPGIRARADRTLDFSLTTFVAGVVKWGAGLALSIWPIILLLCIVWVVWKIRKSLFESIYKDLEWWLFFLLSFGFSLLLCSNGLYRICSGWLMAGIIIWLRNMNPTFLDVKPVVGFAWLVLSYLVIGACLQVRYGLNNYNMLDIYTKDEQGVTYRDVIAPTLWNNVCGVGLYNEFHLNVFRQQYRKEQCPIILSRKLYKTLYLKPALYLGTSYQFGDIYIYAEAEGIAVKVGHVEFSDAEKDMLIARTQPKGWKRFLPGRLRMMFPSDVAYVCLPSKDHQISFVAKDGRWYTIYNYWH